MLEGDYLLTRSYNGINWQLVEVIAVDDTKRNANLELGCRIEIGFPILSSLIKQNGWVLRSMQS